MRNTSILPDEGKAAFRRILNTAGLSQVVVSVRDHISAATIINTALSKNPELKVVVRAADPAQIESLKATGAHSVVNPEFETGMELTKQTLLGLELELPEIRGALDDFEKRRYSLFQPEVEETGSLVPLPYVDTLTIWMRVNDDKLNGRSIADIEFRNITGCTIVAVKRGVERTNYPDPGFVLQRADELCIVGKHDQIDSVESQFDMARFTPLARD